MLDDLAEVAQAKGRSGSLLEERLQSTRDTSSLLVGHNLVHEHIVFDLVHLLLLGEGFFEVFECGYLVIFNLAINRYRALVLKVLVVSVLRDDELAHSICPTLSAHYALSDCVAKSMGRWCQPVDL